VNNKYICEDKKRREKLNETLGAKIKLFKYIPFENIFCTVKK